MPRVTGFLPSVTAFHFNNSGFAPVPVETFTIPFPTGPITIPIGDASKGLCGGMAFAVRDFFEAGVLIPTMEKSPSQGMLFGYFVTRLIDSFNLPGGALRYLYLMDPAL